MYIPPKKNIHEHYFPSMNNEKFFLQRHSDAKFNGDQFELKNRREKWIQENYTSKTEQKNEEKISTKKYGEKFHQNHLDKIIIDFWRRE